MTEQLVARNVSMFFAGQRALDKVDLALHRGEVHALLGANGSGKSTLIKILAGYHTPEHGADVTIGGRALAFGSARASHLAGLRFIHQDLGLVDSLDVAENLRLGGNYGQTWWLSARTQRSQAGDMMQKYGLDIDPALPVGALSAAQKSMVAIIRAVEDGLASEGVLVLDEPTASLPQEEVHQLMDLLAALKAQGVTILYVTHRLPEVFTIADRVTVLRDGRRVATKTIGAVAADDLVELILGKRIEKREESARLDRRAPVLTADRVYGENVTDFSFKAHAGEILGITGLIGSGYESILGLVYGSLMRTSGEVQISEKRIASGSPQTAIRLGVSYAPADRRKLGSFVTWNVGENLTIPLLKCARITRRLSQRAEEAEAKDWIGRLDIRPGRAQATFSDLSGGNQQKVVIARMLRCSPIALLLDEPTIGVDAGAKSAIYSELRDAASHGATVVVASSDTEELAELCDRVIVVADGRPIRELVGKQSPADIARASLNDEKSAGTSPRVGATEAIEAEYFRWKSEEV